MRSTNAMTRYKIVRWCVSHQQYVDPEARHRNWRNLRHCKIIKLNVTLLQQVDLQALSAWLASKHSSRYRVDKPRQSLRLARRLYQIPG